MTATDMRRGFAWTALGRMTVQALQLANVVVLARLLTPVDFGLATITATLVVAGTLIADCGISTAMVHFAGRATPLFRGSALTVNLSAAIAVSGCVALAAGPLAVFFGQSELADLLLIAALGIAMSPWSVPLGRLASQQRFGTIVSVEVMGAAISFGASLSLALNGAGAASLVAGPAISSVVQAVAFYVTARQAITLRWEHQSVQDVLAYGLPLVGFGLLSALASNADRLALARSGSAFAVGVYSRAAQFAVLPNAILHSVVFRVLLPTLAALTTDVSQQYAVWRKTSRDCLLLAWWAVGVGAVTAPFVVRVALGDQWEGAALPFSILLLGTPFLTYQGLASVLFQSRDRTRTQFWLGLITTLGAICSALATAPFGVTALAVGISVSAMVSTIPWLLAVERLAALPTLSSVKTLAAPLAFGSVIGGVAALPLLSNMGSEAVMFGAQLGLAAAAGGLAVPLVRRL